MTTFEERFYKSPNGWFRREGMTICGGGVDGNVAGLGRPDVQILATAHEADREAARGSITSRNQARPAAIFGKGRWE